MATEDRSNAVIEFVGAGYVISGARALVDDLHLSIDAGQVLVLLGRSGSGKTTSLKLVNRLLDATSGQVRVDGKAITQWDPVTLRRGIGYVIQEVGLFPHRTVEQNIATVPRLQHWDQPRIAARVTELLQLVRLPEDGFRRRYPHQLSGGQRQRVGLARALAADPPILLMDEPFGALDPLTRSALQQEFKQLQSQLHKTVLFVTHDVLEALALADRIALLEAGKLTGIFAPQEFVDSTRPAGIFAPQEFVVSTRPDVLAYMESVRAGLAALRRMEP